jgi:Tc5 transposase DNA-binding domain
VNWVTQHSAQGFAIRYDMLRSLTQYLILSRIHDTRYNTISANLTSRNWLYRFVKRHPEIETIISKKFEASRLAACTAESFNKWFNIFSEHFHKYKPELSDIYNVDETGFSTEENENAYVIIAKEHKGLGLSV